VAQRVITDAQEICLTNELFMMSAMFCYECGKVLNPEAKYCRSCGASQVSPDICSPPLPDPEPSVAGRATEPPLAGERLTEQVQPIIVYASIYRRFLASVIDSALLLMLCLLASLCFPVNLHDESDIVLPVLGLLLLPYKIVTESSGWQATLGKRWVGIKVTSLQGERIGIGRATARFFAQILSGITLNVGYLMAGFTPRRQGLHDYIAGTLVTNASSTPEEIEVSPPAGLGSGIVSIIVVFAGIAILGILTAIGVPAYQNYTVRGQINEGLALAEPYKVAFTRALSSGVEFDAIHTHTGRTGLDQDWLQNTGKYEESIELADGTVLITYGQLADPTIRGHKLAIYAMIGNSEELVWICGRGATPPGLDADQVNEKRLLTDVPTQFLPSNCHE
jgi:uncharacterized RDD family membrane protein YckC